MHNYTPEDLIRYLYNEMSTEEAVAIGEELAKNWALREKLAVIKTAQERLNNLVESPRTETILRILRHAATAETVTTQS